MPNLGGPEMLFVLLIFVLLFGAKKLPELGGSIGESIKNFKRGITDGSEDDEVDDEEHSATTDRGATHSDQT